MNIAIEYLYRDAGNFKQWNEVIFTNPTNLDANEVERRIRSRLIDRMFFVASAVRIEELFAHKFDPELDHDWHELDSVNPTNEIVNDIFERSIEEFMSELTYAWCLHNRWKAL